MQYFFKYSDQVIKYHRLILFAIVILKLSPKQISDVNKYLVIVFDLNLSLCTEHIGVHFRSDRCSSLLCLKSVCVFLYIVYRYCCEPAVRYHELSLITGLLCSVIVMLYGNLWTFFSFLRLPLLYT